MSDPNEKGAVLLTTLLVMSIMATVAVNIMDDVRFALKRTANVQAYAQADWYLQGAEDYAKSYLQNTVAATADTALNAYFMRAQPVVLPIDGGLISLDVRDGSTCFSLGSLTQNDGRKLFRQLLETIGWDSLSAATLTSIAADWVDADTQALPGGAEDYTYLGMRPAYRTANAPFTSVGELRALSTMTEERFALLRPFVCARDSEETHININTLNIAQAPILAAILGGIDTLSTAQQLITQRPANGYDSLEVLNASPLLSEGGLTPKQAAVITFAPRYIWVEASVNYRQATRHAVIEYELDDSELTRTFKRLGTDARRPLMLKDET